MSKFLISVRQNVLSTIIFPFAIILLLILICCACVIWLVFIIQHSFTNEQIARESKYMCVLDKIYSFLDDIFNKITGK